MGGSKESGRRFTQLLHPIAKGPKPFGLDPDGSWLPGLVPQSVLVWDGIRIEVELAAQNHVKIGLVPQMFELHGDPLHTKGVCGGTQPEIGIAEISSHDPTN